MPTLPVFSSASRSLITLRNAGFGLTVLTCAGLIAAPAHAQVLTLGQSGTKLSGTATITDSGTTTTAGSIYTYDDGGTGKALTDQTHFSYLYAYGSSTANVSGGFMSSLQAYDNSTANVSGGTVEQLETYNTSTANVSGGDFYVLAAYDTSTAYVSGGSIRYLDPDGSSTVNVSGGTFKQLYTNYTSTVNVSGGTFEQLGTDGSSTANVSGGDITALRTNYNSTLNLFGTGFTETLDYSKPFLKLYSLTGTLQNGDTLKADYYDFGGTLEFNGVPVPPAVPEASSVVSLGLLLLLGVGGVAVRRKRMWQAIVSNIQTMD